jgi:hypothetical protein
MSRFAGAGSPGARFKHGGARRERPSLAHLCVRGVALAVVMAVPPGAGHAQVDFRGELIASIVGADAETETVPAAPDADAPETAKGFASLRYIPELLAEKRFAGETELAFAAAADLQATARRTVSGEFLTDADADVYRLWTRIASPRTEFRVGLQKIAFGSATLLRPMQWFDELDPRDPLQLTDGVRSGLFRYTALNNTNLSLWVLYGNDELRGWDVVTSDPDELEYGGRLQLPLGDGELALSYHCRELDLAAVLPALPVPPEALASAPEWRVGLDGKWDVGIGLWFEGTVIERDTELLPYRYRQLLTVGADYTFNVGTGLTALAEQFRLQESQELWESDESIDISALSTTYRPNIVDQLSLIASREWEGDENSFFVEWRQTHDRWRLHFIVFSAPEQGATLGGGPTGALYSGNGVQVLVVFNH